jgi:uncharacterized protein YjbI with pentapeptide repeats
VVARLLAGLPLDDLGLGECDGRVDLRGLPFPQPERLGRSEWGGWVFEKLGERVWFKGGRLARLDLSGARLDMVVFWDTSIEDCRFDGAHCQHLGVLRTQIIDCSFDGADFREAALGTWSDGGNVYRRVSFVGADLRLVSCRAATFIDCDFSRARLDKQEFESSSFIRCRFAGELREVMFCDRGFETAKPDPNPMEDVDFSEAILVECEFRGLNLDRVVFPRSAGHLVVHHYRCVLERALAELAGDESLQARRLRAVLENRSRWAGPQQAVGVFSLLDYQRWGGPELSVRAEDLLRRCEAACAGDP